MLCLVAQHQRTHHRRQGQRHEAGHQHGAGQRQRKLDEQLAGAPGHESHRGIHSRQGDGHGHDGEADLARPLERRLAARHAVLDVPKDVFQHDDGVVHHQANGQHQSQQRQRIDREAEQVHQRERADQRHRNRHQRHQCGAQVAQKEEDDQEYQRDRFADGRKHRFDRAVDEYRRIIGNVDRHALGQLTLDARQLGAQRFREFERIGRGLLDHADRNRRPPLEAHGAAFGSGADLHLPKVSDAHRVAAARIAGLLDDDVGELFRLDEVGLGHHREFPVGTFDAAGRHFHVLPTQCVLDILWGQTERRQAVAVEPDAHGELALAEDPHVRGARQRLQAWLDQAVGDIGHFQCRMLVGREGDPDDRAGVGFDLGDHRFVDVRRQAVAHAGNAVAHVRGRRIRIALELETHGNLAVLLPGNRGDDIDAFNAGQRILQGLGDLRFDNLGRGAAVGRIDGHHRLVDLRVFAHRQPGIRHQPDQHDGERKHRGKNRPPDAQIGNLHCAAPADAALTGAPSRSFICPATTISSPDLSPSTISTWALRRNPVFTGARTALPSCTR